MEINGYTRLAAVVANPIKHSNSPFIHNRAFDLTSVNGAYLAFEVEADKLKDVISSIKSLNMYGINLSMPYKKMSLEYVDELSPVASLIGAINTIVLREDGSLFGHSTDGLGFFKSLGSYQVKNQEITILGGGGAGLAIIAEACLQGSKKINVFNRKSQNFAPLQEKLGQIAEATKTPIELYDLADQDILQEAISRSSLLVNTTSIGMKDRTLPLSERIILNPQILVADIIYEPSETAFLSWAKKQGAKTINGLGMLVYQAAESYKLWTGFEMPSELIKEELEKKIYETRS
ncbi:shikimate dehydrogenase [Streptococcaceae bacterium ESL0687]|nr:shikimate dehydrogenase [Streptococcaceae bacterium ESL0687]